MITKLQKEFDKLENEALEISDLCTILKKCTENDEKFSYLWKHIEYLNKKSENHLYKIEKTLYKLLDIFGF